MTHWTINRWKLNGREFVVGLDGHDTPQAAEAAGHANAQLYKDNVFSRTVMARTWNDAKAAIKVG